MIDWTKLKPYHNTKNRSFEELCYQIAKGLHGDKGSFTPIDDSGGGDGVEFFMTLPNGEQWGWQAKFYHPEPRLNVSNRKNSIINSLKVTCQNHPHMKKWILCTPTKFTTHEQSWLQDTLPKSIPTNMEIEIEHWGDSDFNRWLSEPCFSGKKNYFFGELELTIDWFDTQVKKQIIQNKFIEVLHTETNVDDHIHTILGDYTFIQSIGKELTFVRDKLDDFRQAIENLDRPIPSMIDWGNYKSNLINPAKSLHNAFLHGFEQVQQALNFLSEREFDDFRLLDLDLVSDKINQSYHAYWEALSTFDVSNLVYLGKEEDRDRVLDEAEDIVRSPGYIVGKIYANGPLISVINQLKFFNNTDLHVLGAAGVGKTHAVSNICNERLKSNLPCLLILGQNFTSDLPLQEQLLRILDVPKTYSWSNFLHALETAAQAYHTRIPIIIDGLNEATCNGLFSKVWNLGLPGLIQEISQTKNIVLITTCRASYRNAIWSDGEPEHAEYVYGFNASNVEIAIEKYFSWYKIKADVTAAPLSQFQHPIYLKIFCESQNPTRQVEKQIYIGDYTLFEVFNNYLEQCNRTICERLGLYDKTPVVKPALDAISEYLWQQHSRRIPLTKLVELVDCQSLRALNWDKSKTKAILDESLLVCRDWHEGDIVYFTYDIFGGYLIAQYLIQQAASDIRAFVKSRETIEALFSDDYDSMHPLNEDINRCLAALLPLKLNIYLHDIIKKERAFNYSINALFEIPPNSVNQNCLDLVSRLFDFPQNRKHLLKLAESTVSHVNHPLNASFWSKQLQALSMPERDISWTEYVRENVEIFEKILLQFEELCKKDEQLTRITTERTHILAEYIMWLLTSTVRPLRDKATCALYWYGRRWPERFFNLILKSLDINDPYVSERMLAATYGVAMALQFDFKDVKFTKTTLPSYGRKLYESMFKSHAPYATTHILARDYARRTIDISLLHHPDLLTVEEKERITPPFKDGGIRGWGHSDDRNKSEYRDGNAPIHMDFENYTLGRLVKDRHNYEFDHEEYKTVRANIFWRIYDLGYSYDTFKDIDKLIAMGNWRYGRAEDGRKTDRYGKKYSWIAFYELAGFRQDQCLLNELYREDVRISDADIDPSFPQPVQESLIINKDLLGDRNIPLHEWIENGNTPDISTYFVLEELYGEKGPWVLLDGETTQEDLEFKRFCFIHPRGLFVKKIDLKNILALLKTKNVKYPFFEMPEDHYTYAGEIPWCDTFSYNGKEELEFVISTKKEKVVPHFPLISIEGIDIENYSNKEQEIEVPDKKESFDVFIPVRTNNWEEYHSSVNTGRSVLVPSKEMAEYLNLCSQPQIFDLYEKNGKRASVTIRCGDYYHTGHHLIFLRQDLLNQYLQENNLCLIWAIWGERQCRSKNNEGLDKFAKQHNPYKAFHEIKLYEKQ